MTHSFVVMARAITGCSQMCNHQSTLSEGVAPILQGPHGPQIISPGCGFDTTGGVCLHCFGNPNTARVMQSHPLGRRFWPRFRATLHLIASAPLCSHSPVAGGGQEVVYLGPHSGEETWLHEHTCCHTKAGLRALARLAPRSQGPCPQTKVPSHPGFLLKAHLGHGGPLL